jgi:uncharacterized protein YndB with AHSA1/START domain
LQSGSPARVDYDNHSGIVEVVYPERIVSTTSPAKFQMTATFTEQSGKTALIFRMRFASVAEREQVKAFAL